MRKGRPAKKYSQAGRINDIIRLIEARRGMTIAELAETTGVGRRSIYRDLNAIQEAGYPLTADWVGNEKVYRFVTGFKDVPSIRFTLQELMTLSLLRSQLDLLNGTPFLEDLQSIFGKVNSVLPPRFAAHMERIAQVSHPLMQGKRDYSASSEPLRLIRQALLHQQRITLSYRPAGRTTPERYRLDPYTLLFHKGGIYLLGLAHERQALRTFALERIAGVELARERFEIPEGFDAAHALQGAFGIVAEEPMQVEVRFSKEVAHAIKGRVWHASQRLEESGDGSVQLTFSAGGRREILSWVLSYGDQAEILAPEALRAEAERMARDMARRYREG